MDVTVLIPTFGEDIWQDYAQRASRSVPAGVRCLKLHDKDGTLAQVRNRILDGVATEFICYLDADDQLEGGFFEAMAKSQADIRAPAVRYVGPNRKSKPRMPNVSGHTHACEAKCLMDGNWLVIGCVVSTRRMRATKWREYPAYEDFDVWQRMWLAGATVEAVPNAVYRAQTRFQSRNRALSKDQRRLVHYQIAKTNLPDRDWEYLKP